MVDTRARWTVSAACWWFTFLSLSLFFFFSVVDRFSFSATAGPLWPKQRPHGGLTEERERQTEKQGGAHTHTHTDVGSLDAMISRAINNIYHLKRVHAMMPDYNLGAALTSKIERLNLKPAVDALQSVRLVSSSKARQMCHCPSSSAPAASRSLLLDSSPREQQQQLVFETATAAAVGRHVLPDPGSLCQLLECLAYFELGASEVTKDALTLVSFSLPAMNGKQLARTLAAVCALGQQEPSVPTLPLLTAALRRPSHHALPSSLPEKDASTALRAVSPASFMDDAAEGIDVIKLMEALQAADVHQEEVWSLIAEHCVCTIGRFDGKELFRVIELFYLEDMRYYPDLFVAAESYVSSQPYAFLSLTQRQQLMAYYKELGQPVVSLLAASSSGAADSFDAALAALPAVSDRRHRPQPHYAGKRLQPARKSGPPAATTSGAQQEAAGSDVAMPTAAAAAQSERQRLPSSAAMDAFVEAACRAIHKADEHGLMDLLRKCELKNVMDPTVMDAAVTRLAQLSLSAQEQHTGQQQSQEGEVSLPSPPSPSSPPSSSPTLRMDVVTLTQLLRLLFVFDVAAHPQTSPHTAATLASILDALADHGFQEVYPRLLPVAVGAVAVFSMPASSSPCPSRFFANVVRYLHDARDTLANESPNRLLMIATILHGLPAFGGHAVLNAYMPFFSLAAANATVRVQVELAVLLASLPSARQEVLPAIYKCIVAQKQWDRRTSPAEAKKLVEAMVRSRVRDPALIVGITEFVRRRRMDMEPSDLVWFMHSLAVLGVRELEFFSSSAEYLLGAVSPVTRTRTSVHDLCEALYIFTFVIKGVIRVVQQIMARLRVSAGQATPRDITLAFFSFVKLQVTRHHDVTGPFCDRAVSIQGSFKGEEVASTLGSLRALGYYHEGLMRATAALLVSETAARQRLTDTQYVSVVTALHGLAAHLSATRDGRRSDRHRLAAVAASSSAPAPLAVVGAVAGDGERTLAGLFADAAAAAANSRVPTHVPGKKGEGGGEGGGGGADSAYTAVCNEFRRVSVRLLQRATAAAATAGGGAAAAAGVFKTGVGVGQKDAPPPIHVSGVQLYLIITTLAAVHRQLSPPLSSAEWALLAVQADARPESLRRGYAEAEGCAAAEVLVALRDLQAAAVPALPSEEEHLCSLSAAAVRRWKSTAPATGARTLASVPPRLGRLVLQHFNAVVANAELREGLRRTGLLGNLAAAVGGDAALDLRGATLTGSDSGGAAQKKPGRGGRRGGGPARSKHLTMESVMAAIDAEHRHREQRGTQRTFAQGGLNLSAGHGPGAVSSALFTPVRASSPEEEEWSPEVMRETLTEAAFAEGKEDAVTAPRAASAAEEGAVQRHTRRSRKEVVR